MTAEQHRLTQHHHREANWKAWGPYLAERAWGTVREDYSANGDAWDFFPHDHARSRAYRWNEDGLAGISDRQQHLCLALALWNGRDSMLKERLFGLSGPQGNHGEDVKELYYYLDNTPTHSYMKYLYKYPQRPFPYARLITENARRDQNAWEYELMDTAVFKNNRYFDVQIEYAKAGTHDILMIVTATNRGDQPAPLHILPTLWFRNTWSWGYENGTQGHTPHPPRLQQIDAPYGWMAVQTTHPSYDTYYFYTEHTEKLLFTENETNTEFLFGHPNASPYVKDAFHRYLVDGDEQAVNPAGQGTKVAAYYQCTLAAGETVTFRLRLSNTPHAAPFDDFAPIFEQRLAEADAFYAAIQPATLDDEARQIQRQAYAGLLWTKQFYYLDMEQWLAGDPDHPSQRFRPRNEHWRHLVNADIISMPDKWEYPWYATWDTAFHTIPFVSLDPDFAKRQLELVTREWYMHPNGQLPAYEWAFDDVNPPVHAWATRQVYLRDAVQTGKPDVQFLEAMFHKLLLNFTWWVNRKDRDGNNVFEGGFLGLDNIAIFDRSAELPAGGYLEQSDGTAWMGFYSIEMMNIALELSRHNPVYQDMASKFFEHFLRIATALTNSDGSLSYSLWDEDDGFFYDILHMPDGRILPLKVRSLVGLMPMLAVTTVTSHLLEAMPVFARRAAWFMQHRPHLSTNVSFLLERRGGRRKLISLLTHARLKRVLSYLFDESEFLSPYGIRSLSKYHQQNPFSIKLEDFDYTIRYLPAESDNLMFGGNSNWRGPVWFPINFLIIQSLRRYHSFYGRSFKIEYPTGSGNHLTLDKIADDLTLRLLRLFQRGSDGRRPIYGGQRLYSEDPHFRDYLLFYEYFNGDNGAGLGASHQTGWTALVATLIDSLNRS